MDQIEIQTITWHVA